MASRWSLITSSMEGRGERSELEDGGEVAVPSLDGALPGGGDVGGDADVDLDADVFDMAMKGLFRRMR